MTGEVNFPTFLAELVAITTALQDIARKLDQNTDAIWRLGDYINKR